MEQASIQKRSQKWLRISRYFSYGTVGGVFLILFFFLVLPISVIMSKAFWGEDGFTLEYFRLLLANDLQLHSIVNSFYIALATLVGCTLLCFPLAVIGARFEFYGKKLFMALLLVPMVMPPFVGAIGIQRFFARFGSLNIFLLERGWVSEPIHWLSTDHMFWAVVILEILHLYPIMYLNLTAALANVDPSLEEVASTLGVSRFRRYRDIVLPVIVPGFVAGGVVVFIWALTDLGTPLLVGFHETIPVHIFQMVTDANENPMGFALVFFMVLLTAGFFVASKFFLSRKNYEMLARGHVTSSVTRASPVLTGFIYVFLFVVIGLALVPHLSVLVTSVSDRWFMTFLPEHYTLSHYSMIFQSELPFLGIKNSLFFASLSTLIDIVLGLVIAYVVTRKAIPMSSALDTLVMIPLALPGIILAFGYVVTYTGSFLDPLANSAPLLVVAYSIRRLPYMVRSAVAGLSQTSRSLEEASETFGASRFHTARKIVVPLLGANIIAGALLCFSYAMLDVSDSLILAMKDQYYPLTKAIYSLYLEQGSGELQASALGMVAMVILAICIMGASVILGKKMGELFRS